jgi:hypothetical protein
MKASGPPSLLEGSRELVAGAQAVHSFSVTCESSERDAVAASTETLRKCLNRLSAPAPTQ